ncbi:MAG: hypothetical protein ACTSVI_09410 [Promethearchaeota archaeon]
MAQIQEIKNISLEILKNFKGALEIDDFHKFLLLNFSSVASSPQGMLAMLGINQGSNLVLSYDPMRKLYFYKILGGNQEQNQIFLYTKREPITDKFITKEPQNLLGDSLSPREIELLHIGTKKKKLIHVNATDFQLIESIKTGNGKKLKLDVDLVFKDLEGFIAGYEPRSRVFIMRGEKGDVLFDVNFSPLTKKEDVNLLTFDVYLDESKEIANYNYISMNMEGKISFIDEIKDSRIQNTLYCLVVPVKSFDIPQ